MSEVSRLEFSYKEFVVSPFPSSKRTVVLYRPMIPLILLYQRKYVQFEALIDSGADYNIFHADIAIYLGITLKKGSKRKLSGIGGKVITGYEHQITLRLRDFAYHAPVTFSADIPVNTLAVLGNKGFFDRFVITLNYREKVISLQF